MDSRHLDSILRQRVRILVAVKDEKFASEILSPLSGQESGEDGAADDRRARIKSLIETDMATAGVRLQFRATGPVKLTSTT